MSWTIGIVINVFICFIATFCNASRNNVDFISTEFREPLQDIRNLVLNTKKLSKRSPQLLAKGLLLGRQGNLEASGSFESGGLLNIASNVHRVLHNARENVVNAIRRPVSFEFNTQLEVNKGNMNRYEQFQQNHQHPPEYNFVGHGGPSPGHRGYPPGHGGPPPGHRGPGHGGHRGHMGPPPGHMGPPPFYDGLPPGHRGAPPGHGGAPPGYGGAPPGHEGIPPGHRVPPSPQYEPEQNYGENGSQSNTNLGQNNDNFGQNNNYNNFGQNNDDHFGRGNLGTILDGNLNPNKRPESINENQNDKGSNVVAHIENGFPVILLDEENEIR